eukprot:7885757-Pyramimonas_sp.AAC.3
MKSQGGTLGSRRPLTKKILDHYHPPPVSHYPHASPCRPAPPPTYYCMNHFSHLASLFQSLFPSHPKISTPTPQSLDGGLLRGHGLGLRGELQGSFVAVAVEQRRRVHLVLLARSEVGDTVSLLLLARHEVVHVASLRLLAHGGADNLVVARAARFQPHCQVLASGRERNR